MRAILPTRFQRNDRLAKGHLHGLRAGAARALLHRAGHLPAQSGSHSAADGGDRLVPRHHERAVDRPVSSSSAISPRARRATSRPRRSGISSDKPVASRRRCQRSQALRLPPSRAEAAGARMRLPNRSRVPIAIHGVSKSFGDAARCSTMSALSYRPAGHRDPRSVRRRQVDAAAHHQPPGEGRRRLRRASTAS